MQGWIKLHRQIMSSSIWQDPDLCRLWIYCLLKATHKEKSQLVEKQEINLKPGQFITGRFKLHFDFNNGLPPRKQVRDTTLWGWLKRLETLEKVDIKSNTKYSIVTVLNWIEYQETLTTEPQQIDNRLTTEPQQIDTNKNVKNLKNDKNERIKEYTSNPLLIESLNDFIEMRKKSKSPLTDKALTLILNKLDKSAKNDQEKIDILNQSVMNSWKGVFAIKAEQGKPFKQPNTKTDTLPPWIADQEKREKEHKPPDNEDDEAREKRIKELMEALGEGEANE
jgi:hypothetical protein